MQEKTLNVRRGVVILVLGLIALVHPSHGQNLTLHEVEEWAVGSSEYLIGDVSGMEVYDGELYFTDSKNSRLWRFDTSGAFIDHTGRAGEGPGEYGRYMGDVAVTADSVYVSDWSRRRIHVYTRDLEFARQISITRDGTYRWLGMDDDNTLVAAGTGRPEEGEVLYGVATPRDVQAFQLNHTHGDAFYDRFYFDVDRNSGRLVAAYALKDTVEVIEPSTGNIQSWAMIRDHAHDAPPPVVTVMDREALRKRDLPKRGDFVSWRVAFDDQGRIWILAGDYTQHSRRTLYVYEPDGTRKAKVVASRRIGALTISGRWLYAATDSGTIIRKFEIRPAN